MYFYVYRDNYIPLWMATKHTALTPLLGPFLHLIQLLPRWAMDLAGMEPCSPLVVALDWDWLLSRIKLAWTKQHVPLSSLLGTLVHLSLPFHRWAKLCLVAVDQENHVKYRMEACVVHYQDQITAYWAVQRNQRPRIGFGCWKYGKFYIIISLLKTTL